MADIKKIVASELRQLNRNIDRVRKTMPPILMDEGWTNTCFDGSFGPLWQYKVYKFPAEVVIERIFAEENARSREIAKQQMEDYWGSKHECGVEPCYWHD